MDETANKETIYHLRWLRRTLCLIRAGFEDSDLLLELPAAEIKVCLNELRRLESAVQSLQASAHDPQAYQ